MLARKLFLSAALLLALVSSLGAQEDGNVFGGVTEYLESLMTQPVSSIVEKVDALIEAAPDDAKKATIAGIVFNFFSDSPVMGQEAVAVHIADAYFLNKKLKWPDESTYPQLYAFAEFNRSSLVGCSAPELILEDVNGIQTSLRGIAGEYKLLYFYDDQCATCRRETPRLASFASSYVGSPLTIVAIYTQDNKEAWTDYVNENFAGISNDKVSFVHLWDPEAASSYHLKYGVLSTPQMLLLDSQNTIIGRRLECEALAQLLGVENSYRERGEALLDAYFESLGDEVSVESIEEMADTYYERYYGEPSVFRDAFLTLFNYLRSSKDAVLQQGAVALAEKYVLGEPSFWAPEYVSALAAEIEMSRLNPLGEMPSDVSLVNWKGKRKNLLSCLGRRNTLVFFHLVTCEDCQRDIEELLSVSGQLKNTKVKLVYVGNDESLWQDFVADLRSRGGRRWQYFRESQDSVNDNTAIGLHGLYDLRYVPHLYVLDRSGRLVARDVPVSSLLQQQLLQSSSR